MAGEIQLNSTTALTEDTGAITLNNVNSATNRTNLGLGSIATQASGSIDIDGGAIDGVTIGTNSAATDVRVDNLKLDGNTISSTNIDGNIVLDPNGTGNVLIGNFTLDADQTVGAGQDNMVLTYDYAQGTIGLEAAANSGTIASQDSDAVAITGGSITGTEFDLKSSGTSVYKSDGTTAVISESGGTATIDNATLGSDIYFPTGHIIQMITADTDTEYLSTSTTTYTTIANLRLNITPTRSGSKIIIMLNGISKLGTNSGSMKTEYRFLVNSSAIEYWYGVQFLNTSAIDDEANHVHIMKVYNHGQTSSFSNLQIDFDFRRTGSNNYGDCAFNYDAQGVNYASAYAMEVTV